MVLFLLLSFLLSLLMLRYNSFYLLNSISFALTIKRLFHLNRISCAISFSGFFLAFFFVDRPHTRWSLQERFA